MALTHLLDTSVIGRLGVPDVRVVVQQLADARQLDRAGITDLEVGYGSRNAREWDQDMADLSVFELVETSADHMRRARQVQRLLASRTKRGRKVPRSSFCRCSLSRPTHAASLRQWLRSDCQADRPDMSIGRAGWQR
jgi:predicted nucleic acid-binding protein